MTKSMKGLTLGVIGLTFALTAGAGGVFAAANSELTQQITAGTLSVDVVDAALASVASPGVAMGAEVFDFNCQTATGTLGVAAEQVYVVNPDATDAGWDVTIAGSATTAVWDATGASADYDFNDSSACTDGADADSLGGQLTVDASTGTVTAENGTATSVTAGASADFVEGSVNSITILTGAEGSDDIGAWSLEGVSLSQEIPAEQPVDTYTVTLNLTVAAK